MGGGAMVAAAAAARQKRVQEVVDAFRVGDATAPERAKSVEQLGIFNIVEAEQLLEEGVLAPGMREGTFYLNEHAYITRRERRMDRKGLLIVISIVLLFLGVLVARRFMGQ